MGNWFTNYFYIWSKRFESTLLYSNRRRLRTDALQVQGEYAVTNNAKIVLSVIQTRYDDKTWRFGGDPPSDNVVRIYWDINF